jgi:hypothetical protein
MLVMTVDTAIRDQSQEMEPMPSRFCERLLRHCIALEFAFVDCLVDASQILVNDPAGAEIEMAHFRVPHLTLG